jgi:hypothetical protein
MRMSLTRKALSRIRSKNLRRDFERIVTSVEKAAGTDKRLAGNRVSSLLSFTFYHQHVIPAKARFAIANSIYDDAAKDSVPHQWERKEGYACDGQGQCTVVKVGTTCHRDTSGGICWDES